MRATDFLTSSSFSGQPRGEHTARADQAFELADRQAYQRAHRDTADFLPELIGPTIPLGYCPMSPQMIREWWLAWWEMERVRAERRALR